MAKYLCRIIEPSFFLLFTFTQTRFIFDVPSAVLSHLRPRFAYVLGHYGHAWGQGGRQPAAAKPPRVFLTTSLKARERELRQKSMKTDEQWEFSMLNPNRYAG